MGREVMPSGPPSFSRWVKATTLGWLLGIVLVVLLAMAWDTVGGGAQFMVGVGMGAGVGLMQARALRGWLESTRAWVLAATVGMGVPFLLWDLGGAAGVDVPFSLQLSVVAGSLLAGVLQSTLLRHLVSQAWWWIPASILGWGLPVSAMALGDSGLLSGPGSLLSVGAIFLGGTVLGAVTGRAILWLPKRPAA